MSRDRVSADSLAGKFFDRLQAGAVGDILGLMTPDATVSLVPLNRHGPMAADGAAYLQELTRAFPDLVVYVRRLFVTEDNTAVAEITIDGTQAGDFLGVAHQEKHVELDQAWLLTVTPEDRISAVIAYWDQNQLYRRLGVKRLDKITITAR
jgi:predicted ester cyclase